MSEAPVSGIRRSSSTPKETPEQRARKRQIQIMAGLLLFLLLIAMAYYIQSVNAQGAFIWVIGLGFGYVLQRSRFCFTASLRDPVLTGGTALTKAVIIALALGSLGYAALQMKAAGLGLENFEALGTMKLPGHVRDAGVHTILGGFVFGIGAVLAGGCASGTLMRIGEGFMQQWIAIVFFIAGSVIGMVLLPLMKASGWLYTKNAVYLPDALGGWLPALLIQFGLLGALYVLADWYGKKMAGEL